ncbi:hypothetical protein IAE22_27625 [Bacillus sp. S34]|nr:hypothetical protein [Bacillus sp. S34]
MSGTVGFDQGNPQVLSVGGTGSAHGVGDEGDAARGGTEQHRGHGRVHVHAVEGLAGQRLVREARGQPELLEVPEPLGTLGALLLDAGSSVTDVRSALEKARDAAGVGPTLAVGVLPALVMVSEVATGAATIVNAEGDEDRPPRAAEHDREAGGEENGRADGEP